MAPSPFRPSELLMALAIVFIWGMNFVVMKFGLREFTPFQLAIARFALASLPFLMFIKAPALPWRWIVLYGLLQGVGQFGFLFTALKVGMSAALASVLMQTQVYFTAALGAVLLQECIGPAARRGMVLAALGIALLALSVVAANPMNTGAAGSSAAGSGTALTLQAVTALGLLLTVCAAASWASANVVVRQMQSVNSAYDPLQFVVWTSLVPVVPLAAMSALFDAPASHENWRNAGWMGWGAAAYLALLATVLAYTLWTKLLKRHAANRVAPFGLAVPVVGLTAGMLILGERVSLWQAAGVLCLLGALLLALWPASAAADRGKPASKPESS